MDPPTSLKACVHVTHSGELSSVPSQFTVPTSHPKWPADLWTSGKLIYSVADLNCGPPDDDLLHFNSRFESGNLRSAHYLGDGAYHLILEYDPNRSESCQWFYFQVTNMRAEATYRFFISGFHKPSGVFCTGAKVFMFSKKNSVRNHISWVRTGNCYGYGTTNQRRASLQFLLRFPFDNDVVYLSCSVPYTFSNLQSDLRRWARSHFFSQRTLCQTVGGRDCPVVRIGGDDDNKPFIFLTGRLHPGESPSSIVVKGLIDFLLGDHQIAKYLVGNFVFVIVPMMCIDGVVEGFYRCSLVGDDLNRVWHAPDPVRHPVVYHTKALMREIVQRRSIEAYIDFHGHSRQHGTFVFACPNDNDGNLAHSEKLFPKLLSVLCDAFAWRKCVFSVPDEKKTASRIVVRQEIGIVQAFTLETSFGGTAGMLYDEMAWRQIGAKVAEGLYHLLARGGSPLRVMAQADLMREIERQQAARAYSQNTTGTPPIARKQVLVRRAVVSRLKRLRVARR